MSSTHDRSSEVADPSSTPGPAPRARRAGRILRIVAAAVLVAATVAMLLNIRGVVFWETKVAAWLAGATFASASRVLDTTEGPAFYFQSGGVWHAIRITLDCSVVMFVPVVLVVGGAMMLARRLSFLRVLGAVVGGAGGIAILNQARLLMLSYSRGVWGKPVFDLLHTFVGSVFMTLGLAATLALFAAIIVRQRRRRPRTYGAAGGPGQGGSRIDG